MKGLSLAALHVGGNGPAGCEALEALVCVVDEDPVFILQVRLTVVGYDYENKTNKQK